MSNKEKLIKYGAIFLACILIFEIISIIGSVINGVVSFFISNNTLGEYNNTYKCVENIDIDVASSSIEIIEGDKYSVDISNNPDKYRVRYKNNTLKIDKDNFSFKDDSVIVITVPRNSVLEELEIESNGKVILEDIDVSKVNIDMGAGSLKVYNSKFSNIDIDGGAGEIKLDDCTLNNLELDSGVGRVEINSSITGNSKISAGVGEVDVTLFGSEDDYSLILEKGIGSIKVNGDTVNDGEVVGNGINKLKIEGGIGSINVNFRENTYMY